MKWQDRPRISARLEWLQRGSIIAVALLFLGFWRIQVIRADHYRQLALNNSIRSADVLPLRGKIFDRDGHILADRILSYELLFDRERAKENGAGLEALSWLGQSQEELDARLEKVSRYPRHVPAVMAENISFQQMAYASARRLEHPEWRVEAAPRRRYPEGEVFSHALGYVSEISRRQLSKKHFINTQPGDWVGQDGMEYTLDRMLRGRRGKEKTVVNSTGRVLSLFSRLEPVPGNNVITSLDLGLGRVLQKAFEGKSGAAVVLDPRSGEILALSSFPEIDPNAFALRFDKEAWQALVSDPRHPLQNKALAGQYSPGSTFKPVVAVAGLEEGVISPETRIHCSGKVYFYRMPFSCWKEEGHGALPLSRAIRHSCNVYFYTLGKNLGIDALSDWASRFGYGRSTAVDLPSEKIGIVPSREWKKRTTGEPWYKGETISVAIGQGALLITPLQQAVVFSALANGGQVMRPFLVSEIRSPDGELLERTQSQVVLDMHMKNETTQLVRKALWSGVNEWGSGYRAKVEGFDVCGKTGTVQVFSTKGKDIDEEELDERLKTHAWFAGFAPRDNPRVVVVVLVEHGGYGGEVAAPIAREAFQYLYEKEITNTDVSRLAQNRLPVRP